jgi:HAD superfamily hydrolase (TIGR01509 family)
MSGGTVTLRREETRGAIFDLDGVIASTAALHERAWGEALAERCRAPAVAGDGAAGDPSGAMPGAAPGLSHDEYRTLLDGRPRLEGAAAILRRRGLPHDTAEAEAFGGRKNALFLAHLDREGAETLPGAVALLDALRRAGIRLGLFTASRNAPRVLGSIGLAGAFDAMVDGATAAAEGLGGKPAPDGVLRCAALLGLPAGRCAYFEDAVSGVAAGRAAGVRRMIGVASGGMAARLRAEGADAVIPSLAAVRVGGTGQEETGG